MLRSLRTHYFYFRWDMDWERKTYEEKIARTCRHFKCKKWIGKERARGREKQIHVNYLSVCNLWSFPQYELRCARECPFVCLSVVCVRIVWKFWRSFTVKMLLMSHKLWVWPFIRQCWLHFYYDLLFFSSFLCRNHSLLCDLLCRWYCCWCYGSCPSFQNEIIPSKWKIK